jgi:hypothetical protein
MARYANQKHIILGHLSDITSKPGGDEPFLQAIRWNPIKAAMRILNGNAFKLWFYLFSWEGQGYYEFSPAGLAKELKMSDEGARNARKELIDKGYLLEDDNGNLEFFPTSRTIT